jgi:hypothetical protein
MRRLVTATLIALAAVSCGGKSNPSPSPTPSPSGSDDAVPVSPGQRLGWAQSAPNQQAIRDYRFVLFVDDMPAPLADASCAAASGDFDCTAALPAMPAGRHVLQLLTTDSTTGRESPRSAQLVISLSTSSTSKRTAVVLGPPVIADASSTANEPNASVDRGTSGDAPADACTTGRDVTCFAVSALGDGLASINRIVGLPDGRLLVLFARGLVQILPSGTPEPLLLGRGDAQRAIADIGIDPDFLATRFVYLATIAPAVHGRCRVDIVRMREVADRLGEAATIVSELPASAGGRPAITIGPDRRLYIALPASGEGGSGTGPYDGLVLRLTTDGRAAGRAQMASPILAAGNAEPAALTWVNGTRLLLGAVGGSPVPLDIVRTEESGRWPTPATPLTSSDGGIAGTLKQVAVFPAGAASSHEEALFILGGNPDALYYARLAVDEPRILSIEPVSLGHVRPTALTVDARGDAILAVERGEQAAATSLLRLRSRE